MWTQKHERLVIHCMSLNYSSGELGPNGSGTDSTQLCSKDIEKARSKIKSLDLCCHSAVDKIFPVNYSKFTARYPSHFEFTRSHLIADKVNLFDMNTNTGMTSIFKSKPSYLESC